MKCSLGNSLGSHRSRSSVSSGVNCCLSQISSHMLRPSGSECISTREANLLSVAKMSPKGLTWVVGTDLLSVTREESQGWHVCYSSVMSLCQLWGAVSVMLSSRKALCSAKQFSLLEQFHETEGGELPSVTCLKVEHRLSYLWERCTSNPQVSKASEAKWAHWSGYSFICWATAGSVKPTVCQYLQPAGLCCWGGVFEGVYIEA